MSVIARCGGLRMNEVVQIIFCMGCFPPEFYGNCEEELPKKPVGRQVLPEI